MSAKVAIVAGAGGPLGRATAVTLVAAGLTVVGVDRSERGLGDLAAAVGGPQVYIDALVGGDGGAWGAEAEREEGLAQRRPLGPVEVEEGVVDVEEDGAEAGQAATWRGR